MVYQVLKENPKEDSFQKSCKTLNSLLDKIKEEYEHGNDFSKNGDKFTNSEDDFMEKIDNLTKYYKKTKDKKYLKISSNAVSRYYEIIRKYQ